MGEVGWCLSRFAVLEQAARPGTSDRGSGNTLRPGDQVYLTLPGGEQHAFQFWPVPGNYKIGGAGSDPYGFYETEGSTPLLSRLCFTFQLSPF
jgi:hypothetical protein